MHETCTKCKLVKPVSEFTTQKSRKNLISTHCKECNSIAKKEWYAKNRDKHYVNVYRRKASYTKQIRTWYIEQKNKPCADCGKFFHHFLMDFDHTRDKEHIVSAMINKGFSVQAIESEIAKCDLVCNMCHRVRTWNRLHPHEPISW